MALVYYDNLTDYHNALASFNPMQNNGQFPMYQPSGGGNTSSSVYNPYSSSSSSSASTSGSSSGATSSPVTPTTGGSTVTPLGAVFQGGTSNNFSTPVGAGTGGVSATGATGQSSMASNFPFSTSPILTNPMGPGPGGAATMGTNYNPANGVNQGTFSATQPPYQYGGKPQSDVNLQTQMNVMGQGNPFQNMAQGYANTAGYNAANAGGQALSQGNNMFSGANAVMNTAFDPQNALYNKMSQQTLDTANAGEAQRGLTSSPYGANVTNQAMNDFNIGWQNAQLQRQISGLNSAGTANTTGTNLGSVGVGQINNAGQLPYQTGQQALSNEQQSVQDWLNYLAGGTNASAGNQAAPYKPSIIFGGDMSANGPGTVSYL